MQNKAKVAAGSAAALAILVAGGLAIALPAQAAPVGKSVSVVESVDANDTDDVQEEVEDGTADGTETETEKAETEDTSDDVGGVAVEDGPQD
jgi:hypothetical protein